MHTFLYNSYVVADPHMLARTYLQAYKRFTGYSAHREFLMRELLITPRALKSQARLLFANRLNDVLLLRCANISSEPPSNVGLTW